MADSFLKPKSLIQTTLDIEDLSFQYLYPVDYQIINDYFKAEYTNILFFKNSLKETLEYYIGSKKIYNTIIYARIKSHYRIYRKITERKNVTLDKVFDLLGFRIITNNEEQCYQILEIVRNIGEPFSGNGMIVGTAGNKEKAEAIRDYIRFPKKNTGYQSIHVNRTIHHNQELYIKKTHDYEKYQNREIKDHAVEFQIRTYEMNLKAEGEIIGDAAHFIYKQSKNYRNPSNKQSYDNQQKRSIDIKIISKFDYLYNIQKDILLSKFEIINIIPYQIKKSDNICIEIRLQAKSKKKSWSDPGYILNEKDKLFKKWEGNVRVYKDEETIELSSDDKDKVFLSLLPTETKRYIYVLTPKGDVYRLQKGSTTIDFAYKIHEDIGNECDKAIVNGKEVKLNTPLENSDSIEIIRNMNARPSLDWLKSYEKISKIDWSKNLKTIKEEQGDDYPFIVTRIARNKILRWYKKFYFSETVEKGRELLFKKIIEPPKIVNSDGNFIKDPITNNIEINNDDFESLLKSDSLKTLASNLNFPTVENLLSALGYTSLRLKIPIQNISHSISFTRIYNEIYNLPNQKTKQELITDLGERLYIKLFGNNLSTQINKGNKKQKHEEEPQKNQRLQNLPQLPASGPKISTRDNLYHLAQCCNPIPYENSLGVIKKNANNIFPSSNGRGIFIHYSNCSELENISVNRRCPIAWNVDIMIEAKNRPNMLSEITKKLGDNGINIEESQVKKHKEKSSISVIKISIDIFNRQKLLLLQNTCSQIHEIPDILNLQLSYETA